MRRLRVVWPSASSRKGRLLLQILAFRVKGFALVAVCVLFGFLVTSCILNPFNQLPIPRIGILAGSPYGSAPLEVTFDISASNDPDGEIVSFVFDFADGTPPVSGNDLSQPLPHTYTKLGQHFASLTVEDDGGKEAVTLFVIMVYDPVEE